MVSPNDGIVLVCRATRFNCAIMPTNLMPKRYGPISEKRYQEFFLMQKISKVFEQKFAEDRLQTPLKIKGNLTGFSAVASGNRPSNAEPS